MGRRELKQARPKAAHTSTQESMTTVWVVKMIPMSVFIASHSRNACISARRSINRVHHKEFLRIFFSFWARRDGKSRDEGRARTIFLPSTSLACKWADAFLNIARIGAKIVVGRGGNFWVLGHDWLKIAFACCSLWTCAHQSSSARAISSIVSRSLPTFASSPQPEIRCKEREAFEEASALHWAQKWPPLTLDARQRSPTAPGTSTVQAATWKGTSARRRGETDWSFSVCLLRPRTHHGQREKVGRPLI